MRGGLDGRDVQDPQSGQGGADPGSQGGLLARLLDQRSRRAALAREISRRAGRRLCQHLGRGQGGGRHLLHLLERARGGPESRRRHGHLPARPVSGEICGGAYQGEDHILAWRRRGARALPRRRASPLPRGRPVAQDHRASGMPARRARRGGLYRLNRRHDRVGAQQAAAPRRHGHGVLDGGQRAGRITRRRIPAPVQSLPAYEADYAAEDSRKSRIPQGGGRDRSRNRRAGAPIGRADGKLETLTARTSYERRREAPLFTAVVPAKAGTYNHRSLQYGAPQQGPRDASVAGYPSRGRRSEKLTDRISISRSTIMARSLLCPDAFLSPLELHAAVSRALAEDLLRARDITATATIPQDTPPPAI